MPRSSTRDRPEVVIHTAAWTDVDGCARDPELAMRRNGDAAGELAPRVRRRGASTSCSSPPTRSSTARGPTAAATRPDDQRNPDQRRTARPRLEAERLAIAAFEADGAGAPARDRPDVVAPRPAGQRLPGQDRGRGAACARPPASRCGPSATRSAARPTPRTSPRRSSSCRRGRARRGAGARRRSTTSSTAAARPAPTGRARSSARPGIDVEVVDVPASHLAARVARRRRGPCSSPRRSRRASRCATGGRPSPTPSPR